jgi:hypothetical protein
VKKPIAWACEQLVNPNPPSAVREICPKFAPRFAESITTTFASFEWEKKWHPEIADAKIALPHVTRWFQENWKP